VRKGFTLLEVVIAMAILGAGIAALLALFAGSLRLAGGARDTAAAAVYASQRLEEALLAPNVEEGEETGPFGAKYRWVTRTTVLPPGEEEKPYRAVRIEVTVTWGDPGAERSVDVAATRWEKSGPDARKARG